MNVLYIYPCQHIFTFLHNKIPVDHWVRVGSWLKLLIYTLSNCPPENHTIVPVYEDGQGFKADHSLDGNGFPTIWQ